MSNFRTTNDLLVTVTNGGIARTSTIAYLKGYGDVWYDKNSVANILSLAEVANKFRITFDTESGNKFILHKSDSSILFFKCENKGLYYHDVRWERNYVKDYTLVSTVGASKNNYTRRQILQADKVVRLYKMIALPSMEDFTSALTTRLVRNSPITTVDAKTTLEIYGPNVAALKGKTTRTKPTSVITESIIPVPQEILQLHKSVTVYADFFYFDGLVFFCSVSRKICYGTAQFVDGLIRNDHASNNCTVRTRIEASLWTICSRILNFSLYGQRLLFLVLS